MGVIKYVDFGAAKILAKNQRTIQRTRKAETGVPGALNSLGTNNSLTGTPMYMSPEVIRNNKRGRHGAMDIWSMGCVVLECATGRKPWSNLDNEWYVKVTTYGLLVVLTHFVQGYHVPHRCRDTASTAARTWSTQ